MPRIAGPLSGAIIACLSGALITLSLAPHKLWPLAIIATGTLFLLLQHCTPRQAWRTGWFFGLGLFGSGASWVYVSIHEFGNASPLLASAITLLFCTGLALCCALCCLIYALIKPGAEKPATNIFLFAAIWLSGEWLRSWLLTGFPWLFIGYSQTESLLSSWAPIVGVYGIGFILCLTGALAAQFLATASIKRPPAWLAIGVAMLWLAAYPLSHIEWTNAVAKPIRASLVQANISQHDKWRPEFLQPTMDRYLAMSGEHWQDSQLIIWPEAAIPNYYHHAEAFLRELDRRANAENTALLTGIPFYNREFEQVHNSVVALGNASGIYHKEHLVPFGEYIPFANLVGSVMAIFDLPMSTMHAGATDQAPLNIHHWQAKPLICYEIVYPGLTAKAAKVSDVIITVSNDSWFGASIGPLQHLQMAQMRALETGRYVLRGTGNGVSAIISPRGELLNQSRQFSREVLTGDFYIMKNQTPWTIAGYWLVPLLAVLTIILIALMSRDKRVKMSPTA